MEAAEFRELMSPEGLRLLDGLPPYDSKADIVRTVSRLRAEGYSPGLVAAVLTQSRLRARAVPKFGEFASRMLFTEAGLEQATRLKVAALHAGRFARAGINWVADLGCGIGSDALALAALDIEVTAVERDEVTAAIAAFNLAAWSNVRVEHAQAEHTDLTGVGGVYLDPARRSSSRRLSDPKQWSPSLDFAFALAERMPTGIKLSPALDRALIPDGCEAQWISVDREVVELGLWFDAVSRAGIGRAALVIGDHGSAELTAPEDSPDEAPAPLHEYLYEPDGAVIRARLIGDLARRVNARPVDEQIAYLSGPDAVATPFATCFRVQARFPLDVRVLRKELAARNVGTIEIKKRGVGIDPAGYRERLSLKGDEAATIVLTRVAGKRTALLVERVRPQAQ